MALINCSMEKKTAVLTSGSSNATSIDLEIIPDAGFVIAARDFSAGANPDAAKIQSITLSDTATSGGPQNDGSYAVGNKVKVTVDFVNTFAFSSSITFDINPSGAATEKHLVPIKIQGTFVVPGSPSKVTFTPSSVLDFASSGSSTDFYAYDNPGDIVTIMVMTIAATSGDFIDISPTIAITNSSEATASQDYNVERVETRDSSSRLTQVVYTVKLTVPKVDRTGDVITFAAVGEDIPGIENKIYGYIMDTRPANLFIINRDLRIFADAGAKFRIKMQRGTKPGSISTITNLSGGTGYTASNGVATISSGSGTGATVNISVGSGGVITSATINNAGSGYSEGEVLTISGGNVNASITIKLVFTVDTTDGIYVFDNSKTTIAGIFEAANSSTTYPSVIDQSNGSYEPATDPVTVDASGVFFKNIVIPADAESKVYRFTITPETGTTVDLSAPDIDTSTNPDVITFDITRRDFVTIEAASNHTVPNNAFSRTVTSTIEYFNHLGQSIGTTKPTGKKETQPNEPLNTYDYNLVIRDQSVDFHLPNQSNSYLLSDLNYTTTLNDGIIEEPTILAELRANANGFNAAEINAAESPNHTAANGNDVVSPIVLTLAQRQALTSKSSFNAFSFSDAYTVAGDDGHFKIKFFTTDATPVYKSQTILIDSDGDVAGGSEQQNTTSISSPTVNREFLYLSGRSLSVLKWGTSAMSVTHNLNTFAFNAAQTSVTTLQISLNISQNVQKFVNDLLTIAGYTNSSSFSISKQVSNDGTSYSVGNITTATQTVKFTITGAVLDAQDGLPLNFSTGNYSLLFQKGDCSTELASAALSVENPPVAVALSNGTAINRELAVGAGDPKIFSVILNFGSALNSLSASTSYYIDLNVVHRLSNQYKSIKDMEDDYTLTAGGSGLASY